MPFIYRLGDVDDEIKRRLDKIEGDFLELRLDLMVYLRELQQTINEAVKEFRQQQQPRPPDTGQLLSAEAKTARLIEKHFSLNELGDLLLDLGVRQENVKGETLDQKTRELAGHMARRGRLGDLVKRCMELRPKVYGWPVEVIERY